MRMLIIMVLAFMLAGCTSGDVTPAETTPPDEPEQDQDEPENDPADPDPAPQPNKAPTVRVTSSVQRATVPFNATINITAEDPDGDALAWTLAVDGDQEAEGTELPASHIVRFEAPGDFTIIATVSDGTATVEATVVVTALEAVNETQFAQGTITGKSAACTGQVDYDEGDGFVEVEVRQATIGHPFFMNFRAGSANDLFLILDAEGNELVREDLGVRHAQPVTTGVWSASGTVPEQAALLVFVACDNLFEANGNPEQFKYHAGPDAADPTF